MSKTDVTKSEENKATIQSGGFQQECDGIINTAPLVWVNAEVCAFS
jgi:hypothetical protein